MKRNLLRVVFVLGLIFIFGLGGYGLSNSISRLVADGELVWWTPLGTPPEPATKFAQPEQFYGGRVNLYVETSSGRIYRCCAPTQNKWEESTSPESRFPNCMYDLGDFPRIRLSNIALDKIKDCMWISWGGVWSDDRDYFIILEDGSVWTWNYYWGLTPKIGVWCGVTWFIEVVGWSPILLFVAAKKALRTRSSPESAI